MRIQHNIMAMNAYRNYNKNTSALSGNLEKLSSGYKINRAGDDAAGLAISEKMRAQITGLNAAQKNVKDGISLVKTAEGAMQEIQDMLNRMDYLATQSSNGTYDNEVDRAALQKEVDQLKTEINRIADSANFNGIKLLDGSLDANATKGGSPAVEAVTDGVFDIPTTGQVLGTNTILHQDAGTPASTEFSVDLHDVVFSNRNGDKMTLKVGDTEISIEGLAANSDDTNKLDADGIITALTTAGTAQPTNVGTITGVTYNGTSDAPTVKISGQDFEITDGGNGRLTFTQKTPPTKESEVVDGNLSVTVTGIGKAAVADVYKSGALTQTGTAGTKDTTITVNYTDKDGKAQSKDITFKSGAAAAASATNFINAVNTDSDLKNLFTAAGDNTGVTFTSKVAGANLKVTGLTVKEAGDDTVAVAVSTTHSTAGADEATAVTGDWNMQTTDVTSVGLADTKRLASTVIKLKEEMVADGNSVTIGNVEYKFTTDAAAKADPTKGVYIGDMVDEDGNIDSSKLDMDKVHERLSAAAADNETWTVSANAGKGITLVEKTDETGASTGNDVAAGNNGIDLSTEKGILATLGFNIAARDAVAGTPGKPLTLQIGDTSESFNQMQVSVGDMHVSAMGKGKYTDENGNEVEVTKTIADIDISNQEGATEAINVIKNAINYVSGVRGDLGAIQNRLDHTANNLSVMAENIQDAESTIRDTDVAEEMMSYVKNNILVQSAQAMLAQANQVPQGVLQLLG